MGLLKKVIVPALFAAVAALIAAVFAYSLLVSKKLEIPQDGWYGIGEKKTDDAKTYPFTVHVADEMLKDLRIRLNRSRISHDVLEDADNFEYGFNAIYLKKVMDYWKHDFNWRKQEKILNSWPQFTTEIDGIKIHFYHAKPTEGKYKKVVPLLIVHGWPGNVFEFYKILPMLLHPVAHNVASATDIAFEVIAPSIPGYGFSNAPKKRGFSPIAAARVFRKLMERIGHKKFYLQGGDWGAVITSQLARMYPESVYGLHLNMASANPFSSVKGLFYTVVGSVFPHYIFENPRHHEYTWTQAIKQLALQESGYMHLQATKPDTIGTGLNDSPMGLAAYVLEKFSVWTNSEYSKLGDGGLTKKFTLDELLTVITIYWTQGNIVPSMRFYKEFFSNELEFWLSLQYVTVPMGHAQFPHEIFDKQPAEIIETSFNLAKQEVMSDGGHFAAFEQPSLLATHLFKFVSGIEESLIRSISPFCGAVAILLNILHFWLLVKHSPMYDKVYRITLIVSHIFLFSIDIIFFFLFVPYPLFPFPILLCNSYLCQMGITARFLAVLTAVPICGITYMMLLLFFLRLQMLLPTGSFLRMTRRSKKIVFGVYAVLLFSNVGTFGMYAGDHKQKMLILEDPVLSWINQEIPSSLVWGDNDSMESLRPFLLYMLLTLSYSALLLIYLLFGTAYAMILYAVLIRLNAIILYFDLRRIRDSKTSKKRHERDRAFRLVVAQIIGAGIFFLGPMIALAVGLAFGSFFENKIPENILSYLRLFFTMLFLLNSTRNTLIHLTMNTHYRRFLFGKFSKNSVTAVSGISKIPHRLT